ncbi:hypothetical protein [Kribbella sp. NBC_00359]|uniref:hypothetical protein n=1 Tax=Kribbella sp. NBC_00359 TaxID=2975966 RepID=UPI002E21C56B
MDAESERTDADRTKSLGRSFSRGLGSFIRGLSNFAAGFRRGTWDRQAEELIDAEIGEVSELRSLAQLDKQRIDSLLKTKRQLLRDQVAVELIANRVTVILCISAVVLPAVIVGRTADFDNPVWLYFATLSGLALVAGLPLAALETLTGRERAGGIWVALVFSTYMAIAIWYVATPDRRAPEDSVLVAAITAWTGLIIVLVGRVYLSAWNQAALTRVWRERRVEAVVVVDLLAVVQILEREADSDPSTRRPMESTGKARALLADAAQAVNDHLPRLIDGRRAFTADAETIAREAAAALLDLRSAVTLPGGRVRDDDFERLKTTVEKWSVGSLHDLPRTEPSPAESKDSERRRLRHIARTLALGAVPLVLLVIVTLLPFELSGAVTEALTPFAVTWLLLSVAAVFAPAEVKLDTKTLFNR